MSFDKRMASNRESFDRAVFEWDLEKLYKDLAAVKQQVSFSLHRGRGLTEVEKLHLRGLLCGFSPQEIADKLFKSKQGVKVDLSKTIYRYVKELVNCPAGTVENWRNIPDWLEQSGYKIPLTLDRDRVTTLTTDWGEAPEVNIFYGRTFELATLHKWIGQDHCRLVALFGMGGIGKTALSVNLIEQIGQEFDRVVWRSLQNVSSLDDFLAELKLFTMENTTKKSVQSEFIDYLANYRCLIVLDGLETLLCDRPTGNYLETYQEYGDLIKRLATERHQSCVMVTSREKPQELVSLEGEHYPIRSLQLGGSQQAARGIFQERGLEIGTSQSDRLIQIYGGNPLALKMIATLIQEVFGGNIKDFLKQNTTFIDREMRGVLTEQMSRLSELEKEIMLVLAEHSTPIPILDLIALPQFAQTKSQTIAALDSLNRRSLIDRSFHPSKTTFALQPIVSKYMRTANYYS
ncbi:MAG: hypothetical protein RLZZ135_1163 [Cyanobacteriota bacterium]|jgi:hypothetical protein